MSMFSEIAAQHCLEQVKTAVGEAKKKAKTKEAKQLLDEVLLYCEENFDTSS